MPALAAGFYGKLPARGDFVRGGLPRDFTGPWDAWLARVIAGSRARMGAAWLPAFLEAPVWRFALMPGLCGEHAVLGLMLPSVDRAGRYFPLTFAALFDRGIAAADAAWLDRCEAAGRAALERDADQEQIGNMIGLPGGAAAIGEIGPSQSLWWTVGAPRVPATRFVISGMPDACVYGTMLDATAAMDAGQATEAARAGKERDSVPDTPTKEDPGEPSS